VRSHLPVVVTATLAALAACAEAGGKVEGGDLTEPGALANTRPVFVPPDTGAPPPPPEDVGSGTKWSDLYRDIFGPTGRPGSCSFAGNCHGTPEGAGAKSGSGIHCYDQKTCRESLLAQFLVEQKDVAAPDGSNLFGVLRFARANDEVVGIMPKEPSSFRFPLKSIARIRTWMADGFKDD
jgi:hypothetical protein